MRKLASVQRIYKIEPIEGADRIELAHVSGIRDAIHRICHRIHIHNCRCCCKNREIENIFSFAT